MKRILQLVSMFAVAAGLSAAPSIAHAQDYSPMTLRLEGGVALPLTQPQVNRFDNGGQFTIKPEIGLNSYVSVGPSFSFLALPSDVDAVDMGTAWEFGAFGRVKRPHDSKNTGHGLSAVSPWVDADVQYVRTGELNRLGLAGAVGASVPTSDSRQLWVGPFVRYQHILQTDHTGYDTSDAKLLVLGLSFEFDPGVKAAAEPCPPVPAPVVQQPPVAKKELFAHEETTHRHVLVQFAWDNAELNQQALNTLDAFLSDLMNLDGDFSEIHVEGHASSEGQVEHNNVLSKKRAQAVADYLVKNGVPVEAVSVKGFGSSVPVADNATEPGRVLNRRAEFDVDFTIVVTVEK